LNFVESQILPCGADAGCSMPTDPQNFHKIER
jgi:hypothetical protein